MPFQEIEGIHQALYDTLIVADEELEKYSKNYDEIPEGIKNTPLLIISWANQVTGNATDRATFRAGVRITDITFYCDLYLSQRSWSYKIFPETYRLLNKIEQVLIAQEVKPYFGLDTIKSYQWSVERATFEYESNDQTTHQYPGVRFTINVRLF